MAGVLGGASSARRVRDAPGLRLLRADLMPVLVSVLAARFAERRVVSYSELVTLVAEDLDELRDAGFTLPRTAQEYLHDWVRDGILIRRATATREETVELSQSASDAVRFVQAIERPQSTVTSSRLANLADLLGALARDSDPDPESRIDALRAQRDAIQTEMDRLEIGEGEPLDPRSARERLGEILTLAADVPGDFAKVAEDLERLNQNLREQIVEQGGPRGNVLDEVFDGVAVIERSDAGRTFEAFHLLLMDVALVESFDDSVDAVLSRPFTADLATDEAVFLRRFLTDLQRESKQVRDMLTGLSRSLRRFVQTQEYREHRRLAAALSRAEQAAMAAARQVAPTRDIARDIDLTSITISSIGGWALHNPSDMRVTEEIVEHATEQLDLEQVRQLVRLTEIDFPELQRNVADVVAVAKSATVADVLSQHQATQGLASIVGLLLLASEFADSTPGSEEWSWESRSGVVRHVRGPRYVFHQVPEHWTLDDDV